MPSMHLHDTRARTPRAPRILRLEPLGQLDGERGDGARAREDQGAGTGLGSPREGDPRDGPDDAEPRYGTGRNPLPYSSAGG